MHRQLAFPLLALVIAGGLWWLTRDSIEADGPSLRPESAATVEPALPAESLVRAAAEALGGKGGGGRPDMAQAGGADPSKATEAIAAAEAVLAG